MRDYSRRGSSFLIFLNFILNPHLPIIIHFLNILYQLSKNIVALMTLSIFLKSQILRRVEIKKWRRGDFANEVQHLSRLRKTKTLSFF